MATTKRSAVTGKPGIPTPAAVNLQTLQQQAGYIRTRLDALDAAVNQAFTTIDASGNGDVLASLQTQITLLTKQMAVLQAKLDAVVSETLGSLETDDSPSFGGVLALLAETAKAMEDLRQQPGSDSRAELAEVRKKIEDLQTAPPDGTMAAIVELTKRVEGLEQGVLA